MQAVRQLSREFIRSHPSEATRILETLPPGEASALLEELPPRLAAMSLSRMNGVVAAERLVQVSGERVGGIVGELGPEAAAGLLQGLDTEERDRLLSGVPTDRAEQIRRRLRFPSGTAGAIMDSKVLTVASGISVGQALRLVRQSPRHLRFYLYVLDEEGRLDGVVSLRELMLAQPSQLLEAIMKRTVVSLAATDERARIVGHAGWRVHHILPVVDRQRRFLGVVRYATIRKVQEELSGSGPTRPESSFGLAFADLCWVGMIKMVDGLVGVVSSDYAPPDTHSKGGRHGRSS